MPGSDEPHFAKLFDIHMLCWGTGRERTIAEYATLAERGLSGTTISLAHGVLHKALDDAARDQLGQVQLEQQPAAHASVSSEPGHVAPFRTATVVVYAEPARSTMRSWCRCRAGGRSSR